jgi:hypothetical protein
MRRRLFYGALAVTVTVGAAACDENLSDLTGPTPNLVPTFSSIQREIFDTTDSSGRVACINCHAPVGGRNPSGGLNLTTGTSHAALVNIASLQRAGAIRVIPGDPDNSYLVRKLEGGPEIAGLRMPRGQGPYLTPGQMLVIRRWIAQGARND